jgi:hypothetical protein
VRKKSLDYTKAKDKVTVEKSLISINKKLLGLQKTLTDFDAIAKIDEARIYLASRASKLGNCESSLSMSTKKAD